VVSSVRAVHALEAARPAHTWPRTLRGAAAGSRTAQALRTCGLARVTTGSRGGAEALLEALLAAEDWSGRRVLAPHAAEGRRIVEAGLTAAGAVVDEPVAYRTAPVPAAIIRRRWRAGCPEAAVIASPSAARSLVGALGAETLRKLKGVVAIGPTTAATLRELEVPSRVATFATFESAAQTLREQLAQAGGAS
jgi:uroporphyrinogen III methyltransferase/synthase